MQTDPALHIPDRSKPGRQRMLKYFFIAFAFLALVVLAMAGLRGHRGGQAPD